MVLSKFWNILGSGTSHQNICAVTFAIVWWIFTQISIGIHKRFLHADFACWSWSHDFAMLTNRKLLGIESDFFAAVLHTSLVLQRGGTFPVNFTNIAGILKNCQYFWKCWETFRIFTGNVSPLCNPIHCYTTDNTQGTFLPAKLSRNKTFQTFLKLNRIV